ncbi:PilN domain-containing protein [Radiobacillus sp. PE A8.2]|uniref:PilN domain-containing protein n=1 Tax=Radiobacillus sp. PE A8.2 TaxID=3380349 RepID=UPI0038900372
MIVEINLIEPKKRRNRAPYFISFISILLIAGILFLLYWGNNYFNQQIDNIQQQLATNQETVQEVRAEAALQDNRALLQTQIVQIEQSIFPTVALMDYMIQLLPDGGVFQSYSHGDAAITIATQMDTFSDTAAFTNTLQQQSFITSVEANAVQATGVAENQYDYLATYVITIDEQAWMKEANPE